MDQHALVGRPGLEQADADARVLAQARRQHAAGRAAADDRRSRTRRMLPLIARTPCASRPRTPRRRGRRCRAVELALARDAAALVVEALGAQPAVAVAALVHAGRDSSRPPRRARRASCLRTPSCRCRGRSSRWRSGRPSATTYSVRVLRLAVQVPVLLETQLAAALADAPAPLAHQLAALVELLVERRRCGRPRSPATRRPIAPRAAWCRRRRTSARRRRAALASCTSRTAPLSQSVSLLRRSPRSYETRALATPLPL